MVEENPHGKTYQALAVKGQGYPTYAGYGTVLNRLQQPGLLAVRGERVTNGPPSLN